LPRVVAAISLLIGGSALAQTANDPHRRVDGARVQAADAEWRRLPQSEIYCVDHALHAKRSSVWLAIQQGINPSDASVAAVRAACRTQRQAPKQAATVRQVPAVQQAAAVTPVAHGNVKDAPTAEYWSYDGSVLNSIAEGDAVKFFYVKPSPALKAEGAKFGTILFEGKLSNQKYVGTAYSFGSGCGRMPFQASGAIVDDNKRVELLGHRPRLDKSCKIVSSELDNLTFDRVDTAFADASQTVASEIAAVKAATDKIEADKATAQAVAEKATAEKAAVEKAAAERAATDKAAAEKAASDKAAANKAAAEKAAAEKAASDKAAVNKAAAEKTAAEKAAAEKVAAEKASAEQAAAAQATLDKEAAEKAAAENTATQKATIAQASPDKAALDLASAEAERARAEAAKAQADADRARSEAEKAIADAGVALAASESKLSFIYGLLSGLALVGLGGAAFLVMLRQRMAGRGQGAAVTPESGGGAQRSEIDRLLAAVLDEYKRFKKAPQPSALAPQPPVRQAEPVDP
jgi:hypothetical protein